MTTLTDTQKARLQENTLSLCFCWRLTRRDGAVFGLTSHDRALEYEDLVYVPGAALTGELFAQRQTLSPGDASAQGVLNHVLIQTDDLLAGLWDGCRVDVFRADWQSRAFGLLEVWSGYFSTVTQNADGTFSADLLSLKADLQRPIGRVIQRRCDAVLGDQRCGIPANNRTCDQRFETCRDVFANTENFRGFPHLPGNDFILSGPAATDNDGGKR